MDKIAMSNGKNEKHQNCPNIMEDLTSSVANIGRTDSYIKTIINDTEKPSDEESRKILLDDILQYLENGAQFAVDETGKYNENLAHAAARLDLPELTKYLVDNSVPVVECPDAFDMYPWHAAAIHGSTKVLEEHQSAGHDIISRAGSAIWSILHIATLGNQTEFIRHVLDNKLLPVDHKDSYDRTSLFLAIQYQKREAAYTLLEYGADQTEKTKLKITPLGLSGYFMPELTTHFLDEIQEFSSNAVDTPENFLKYSQSTDLNIALVSPKSNELVVHPIIRQLIYSVYLKNVKSTVVFIIFFFMDMFTISLICMTEHNELWTLLDIKEDNYVELVLVVISIAWIAICTIYKMVKLLIFVKVCYKNSQDDVSGRLINCSKTCTNERVNLDMTEFISFSKQLRCNKTTRLLSEANWTVIGTIARCTVIILCLVNVEDEYDHWIVKHYLIFTATIIIFFDIIFHDANDIFFLPDFVMITLLSMKECVKSFVIFLIAVFLLSMPYFLIMLKFTYKDNHYFTNIKDQQLQQHSNGTTVGVKTVPAIGWGILYLFKVMLTDDYQIDYFNDKHPLFFLVYHMLIVFLLSLVVMNLIIAQTSQTYETFVENSKAEILKHRIFTIILFGMYTRVEDALETRVEAKKESFLQI